MLWLGIIGSSCSWEPFWSFSSRVVVFPPWAYHHADSDMCFSNMQVCNVDILIILIPTTLTSARTAGCLHTASSNHHPPPCGGSFQLVENVQHSLKSTHSDLELLQELVERFSTQDVVHEWILWALTSKKYALQPSFQRLKWPLFWPHERKHMATPAHSEEGLLSLSNRPSCPRTPEKPGRSSQGQPHPRTCTAIRSAKVGRPEFQA